MTSKQILAAMKRAHDALTRALDYVSGLDNGDQSEVDFFDEEVTALGTAIAAIEGRAS